MAARVDADPHAPALAGLDALRGVPGLGPATLHRLHAGLGVRTLAELEAAVADGRVAALPGFGTRAADRVRKGLASLREAGQPLLLAHAQGTAARLAAAIADVPGVAAVHVAGEVARALEVVHRIVLVVACEDAPTDVAARIAALRGGRASAPVSHAGGATLRLDDATTIQVACVPRARAALAAWRATGSAAHVARVTERLAARGWACDDDRLRHVDGTMHDVADEPALYALAGLAYVPPELREDAGEVDAAADGTLPALVTNGALTGVLHCHSDWSDGTADVDALARAAFDRGWAYVGISDHSRSALNAGGLSPDDVARQHDAIDAVNARGPAEGRARVLKGIEADILPCGRIDYDRALLDRFDYVIASVHTRFGMNAAQMTDRVCKALDDPHVTILGHPTGRLLLQREPYAIDLAAVLARAAETGVAVELNADPHRLDLDWRWCRAAKAAGATVAIGPDAHSIAGLDHVALGVAMARKGWLEPGDVLNARPLGDVLAFARRRRA